MYNIALQVQQIDRVVEVVEETLKVRLFLSSTCLSCDTKVFVYAVVLHVIYNFGLKFLNQFDFYFLWPCIH